MDPRPAHDPETRARIHRRVRTQHATELAQDYVEAIHELGKGGRPITVRALQDIFGVSHVTIIRALQRLEDQGLLSGSRSKEIALTPNGERMARNARRRHDLLCRFFIALGVSPEQADADAEGTEHHLSDETLAAVRKFLGE